MFLARSTWPQVRTYFESRDTVLIGVGSIECHGRHNPLGTDTMAPDHLVKLVDERYPEVLIAPTAPPTTSWATPAPSAWACRGSSTS